MTTFKAKIVKCSKSSYWYSDNIGETVELERPVINGDQSEYWLQLKGSNRHVNINDFEEVKEGPEVFPFEVMVTKCSNNSWWYYDKIGKVYQAISDSKQNDQDYMIKDHQPIQKSDCVRLSSSAPKVLEAVGKPEYIYFGEKAPFDLEKALAGEPVVNRAGKEIVGIIHFPTAIPTFRVYALAIGESYPTAFDENGKLNRDRDCISDLFMKVMVVESWMPIYGLYVAADTMERGWYKSLEECKKNEAEGVVMRVKGTWSNGKLISTTFLTVE